MKVSRERDDFKPITIVLETPQDYIDMHRALSTARSNSDYFAAAKIRGLLEEAHGG